MELLVLGGTRSDLNHARMRELVTAIPNARYVAVDLGHGIHVEQPSVFLREVGPFVQRYAK